MIFTRLPAFTSVGPALAISISIAFFAAITLLPAVVVLAGRRGWVTPRAPLTSRLWQRSAVQLVRHPKSHLFVSLAVLIGLGACALMMQPTFNDRMQLPASAESNQGFSEMAEHFSTSALLPEYIYIQSPHDLRNPKSLADMEQMASVWRSCRTSPPCAASPARQGNHWIRPRSAIRPVRSDRSSQTHPHRSAARQAISTRSAAAHKNWLTPSAVFETRSVRPPRR